MLPPNRPKIDRETVVRHLVAQPGYSEAKFPIAVVGFRAYYKRTMGDPTKNDRGIYDDAICIVTPSKFAAFNGNTDPSAREGAVTGRASLVAGFWPMWRLDLHRGQYRAFCQRAAECVVTRDNTMEFEAGYRHAKWGLCLGNGRWRGWFGINGHRGGRSEGCQTIPEPQWTEAIDLATSAARELWTTQWTRRTIPYLLIEA